MAMTATGDVAGSARAISFVPSHTLGFLARPPQGRTVEQGRGCEIEVEGGGYQFGVPLPCQTMP